MKWLPFLAGVALLASCASAPPPPTQIAPASEPTAEPVVPVVPPLRSGIDLAGIDRNVRPQDNLYHFVGGRWLAQNPLPADRFVYGSFEVVEDRAETEVRAVVEAAAQSDAAAGTPARLIGDFYRSFMDTARLATLGVAPLQTELRRIDAIRGTRDLYEYLGRAARLGINTPALLYVGQDAADATQYLAAVYQGGLTMPDRDYYLSPEPKFVEYRAAYRRYVETLLAAAGERQSASAAKRIEALETRLANHQWSRVQNRDPVKMYNRRSLAELATLTPYFEWLTLLTAARVPVTQVNINQPSYVQQLARLVRNTPLADWRDYLRLKLLDGMAPYLGPQFEQMHFEFHQQTLRGVREPLPRWKRALQAMDAPVGELVGQLYVERTFPPQAKARVRALVDNLLATYKESIDQLDWMSESSRAEAQRKLARFTVKIGYPDRWKNYTGLEIRADDLVGNLWRGAEFEFDRQVAKLGKPLDRNEWLMTPQTVNAYYYPPMNEIVFPAAILQPPFFDPQADDAVNYGAIGAVIGHEIGHGFDDQGRQYDGDGNLRDWWTFEDSARFRQKAGRLVTQYGALKMLDGRPVNGELTLGENIGDLTGVTMALRAYQRSLGGAQPPVIDGFTGLQRFFMGWAQVWVRNITDAEVLRRLSTDPHSPAEFRSNVVVSNLDEFQQAFDVKEGDALYRPPAERVKIW